MFLSSHNTKKRNGLKNKKEYKRVEILYLDRSGCLTGFLPIDTTVTTDPQEMTTQFILVLQVFIYCKFVLLFSGYSMECYVCENQDDNTGKCLKTIKTCDPDEDMCLSEIKWGSKLNQVLSF